MPCNEMKAPCATPPVAEETAPLSNPAPEFRITAQSWYDPELLYVECRQCGKPVLWEPGRTTQLLLEAGVDMHMLDERCLILSEGCPVCRPEEERGFTLAVVRVAGLTPEEAVYMSRPAGTA